MAYFNGEALREGSLCQVRERHRLPNSMHAPRACLAVLRSAAVEFGRVVSVRDQVHDVHWGKWGRGVQLEAVVVNLSFLCAFRAVRHWISHWYNRTVRKRLKMDACEVMQLTGRAHEHVPALVQSFL